MYETKRNNKRTSATSRASNSSAERRLWNPRGCQNSWFFRQFSGTVARCPQKRRCQSSRTQADTRSAKETFVHATSKVGSSAKQRPDSLRLQNELVDIGTYCSGDSQEVSSLLPSFWSLANPEADGLQLSKARTQSPRTRRTANSHLAKERLAPYKKKLEKGVKPSFCWMKAALCFSRLFGEPGLGKDKPPFIIAGTVVSECRLFLLLRFLRNAGIWGCILLFVTTILLLMILRHLLQNCCRIFSKGLSWLWIAGWSIAAALRGCRNDSAGLMWNGCHPMHRISIRSSKSGIAASIRTWPTIFPKILLSLKRKCLNPSIICVLNNHYYDPFSKRLNLNYDSFLYLCKDQ